MTQIATIGFTKKSAEHFFGLLRSAGVRTLVDVRLKNKSQLAGFAQGRDLPFFLRELVGASYIHEPLLAPTAEILDAYRNASDWEAYEVAFGALLEQPERQAALTRLVELESPVCLLCSEHEPDFCHRRLVAERLEATGASVDIVHLT